MQTVHDWTSLSRVLRTSIDPRLKQLLKDRIRQLDVEDLSTAARFLIVGPDDTLDMLQTELGFPIQGTSRDGFGCEWIQDHVFVFELVWILTDDGFAHVVFVTKAAGTNPELLHLCTTQA